MTHVIDSSIRDRFSSGQSISPDDNYIKVYQKEEEATKGCMDRLDNHLW